MRAAGDPDLKLYGIFGDPLGHTVSPAIQNCAFDYYGLKSVYFAFERSPAGFRWLMRNLKSLLLDGFNVTVPFKEIVIPYLARLSREAEIIGAVNTVKKEKSGWVGYNTDAYGFFMGLRSARFKVRGRSAVILGSGGSARAVAYALARAGAGTVAVVNRTESRAKRVVNRFQRLFPKVRWEHSKLGVRESARVFSQADLIVNATKVGLKKLDPSLIPKKLFPKRKMLVYDLIYSPRRTALLRLACELGHRTLNGESMLLYQGAKAFEIWTGKRAPIHRMKRALKDALIHSD